MMSTLAPDNRLTTYAVRWQVKDLLLRSPAWLDYLRGIYSLDPGEGHPFYTYVGINFTKDAIKNYKFYFAFYRKLSPEEISIVLPVKNRSRFDEFYAGWQPTKASKTIHRGTTFAVKVEADGTLTHYYHLRVPGLPFGPPERLSLHPSDRDNYHGVCEEFTGKKAHLKRYFYCANNETIAESLRLCGLPDRSAFVEWLEYIESDGRDKMTWVATYPRLIQELVLRNGPPELGAVLTKMCFDTGIGLYAPGSARDGSDHSVYFFRPGTEEIRIDGVRSFATRYLKLEDFPAPHPG